MPSLPPSVVDELRELLTDLRAASEDGRTLADRHAELLKAAVDGYCVEFDKRAEALLQKLDAAA